jgi:hypothetical protein
MLLWLLHVFQKKNAIGFVIKLILSKVIISCFSKIKILLENIIKGYFVPDAIIYTFFHYHSYVIV